jgi:hypothetical protein
LLQATAQSSTAQVIVYVSNTCYEMTNSYADLQSSYAVSSGFTCGTTVSVYQTNPDVCYWGGRRLQQIRRILFTTFIGTALTEFSKTNPESYPWWQVTLNGTYYLGTVTVTSPLALSNVIVTAGMDSIGVNNPVCAAALSLEAGQTVAINCTTGQGARYVAVTMNNTSPAPLSLCHVKVYAHG